MATYFCDGLKEVTILNGVVRLEFHRLQATGATGPNREVQPVTEFVVALPAQNFVPAIAMLERVRDELIKQGIVRPAAPEEERAARPDRSPNFS
jgi:hypothetical protein